MRQKFLLKQWLSIVASSGIIIFVAIFLNFIPGNLAQGNSTLPVKNITAKSNQEQIVHGSSTLFSENNAINQNQEEASIGLPMRLKIPKINVNASLESVGLTSDGAVGIPKNPINAAWFNLGPRPGTIGNAVISGHINWYHGATGVFANLRKINPGDKIIVQDDKGITTSFIVRESRNYDATANAVDVFISNDGKAHLNLITCTGSWNKEKKTYSERLVVFTDKE